jgi:hypothetical protein
MQYKKDLLVFVKKRNNKIKIKIKKNKKIKAKH